MKNPVPKLEKNNFWKKKFSQVWSFRSLKEVPFSTKIRQKCGTEKIKTQKHTLHLKE